MGMSVHHDPYRGTGRTSRTLESAVQEAITRTDGMIHVYGMNQRSSEILRSTTIEMFQSIGMLNEYGPTDIQTVRVSTGSVIKFYGMSSYQSTMRGVYDKVSVYFDHACWETFYQEKNPISQEKTYSEYDTQTFCVRMDIPYAGRTVREMEEIKNQVTEVERLINRRNSI